MKTTLHAILVFLSLTFAAGHTQANPGSSLPDFVGQAGTAETDNVHAGHPFASSFTLTNSGSSVANGPVKLRYQLVRFPTDSFPITLGRQSTMEGAPTFSDFTLNISTAGSTSTADLFLTVPRATSPGTYQLRVRIDPDNLRAECNESNNVFVLDPAVVLQPTADLRFRDHPRITVFGSNVALDAGETFNVSAWVENDGDLVDLPPFAVDFYLVPPEESVQFSASFVFNPNDYILLGRAVGPAFPATAQTIVSPNSGSIPITATFALPANLDLLRYKIGAVLDPENTIIEQIDERVNGSWNRGASIEDEEITITYVRDRPDYASGGASFINVSPETFAPGDMVEFSGQVVNLNTIETTDITVLRHYLVREGSSTKYDLGISLLPPVVEGAPFNFAVQLQIPDLVPTEYSYRFEIDSVGGIPESDEANNRGIDLDTSTMVAPTRADIVARPSLGMFTPLSLRAGQLLNLQATIANEGFSNSGLFFTRFVLSRTATLRDSDDILLSQNFIPNLGAGNTATLSPSVTLPGQATLAPGTYYIGWIVDINDTVQEIDETNNGAFAIQQLTIAPPLPIDYPDLAPSEVEFANLSYRFGDALNVQVSVKNNGDILANSSDLSLSLSTDIIAGNSDDIPLITQRIGRVALAGILEVDLVTSLPSGAGLSTGPYYIVVSTDATDSLDEISETNNEVLFASQPVRIRQASNAALPALHIVAAGATPSSLLPGATITPLVNVRNLSIHSAIGVTTEVVLSRDRFIGNADDITLASYGPEKFEGLIEKTYSDSFDLPSTLEPGTYHLSWIVDPKDFVAEVDKSDNIFTAEITVREPLLQMFIDRDGPDDFRYGLSDTLHGFSYRIQFSYDLSPGSWQNAGPVVAGNPNREIYFGIGPPLGPVIQGPKVFFRAQIIPTN